MSVLCIHPYSLSIGDMRRKFCLDSKRVNQAAITPATPPLLRDFTWEQTISSMAEN